MNKNFQSKAGRAVFAHNPDFIHRKLARQDNSGGPKPGGFGKPRRIADICQGGKEKTACKAGLARKIEHCQILDNQPVIMNLAGQAAAKPARFCTFFGFYQGIHGHINLGAVLVGQLRQARQIGQAEVFRLHSGRKMLEPKINGIGASGKRRQEAGFVSSWRKDFGLFIQRGFHNIFCTMRHSVRCRFPVEYGD